MDGAWILAVLAPGSPDRAGCGFLVRRMAHVLVSARAKVSGLLGSASIGFETPLKVFQVVRRSLVGATVLPGHSAALGTVLAVGGLESQLALLTRYNSKIADSGPSYSCSLCSHSSLDDCVCLRSSRIVRLAPLGSEH